MSSQNYRGARAGGCECVVAGLEDCAGRFAGVESFWIVPSSSPSPPSPPPLLPLPPPLPTPPPPSSSGGRTSIVSGLRCACAAGSSLSCHISNLNPSPLPSRVCANSVSGWPSMMGIKSNCPTPRSTLYFATSICACLAAGTRRAPRHLGYSPHCATHLHPLARIQSTARVSKEPNLALPGAGETGAWYRA
jgi:hypothetical protein